MKAISLLFLAALTAWAVSVVSHDISTRKITNASIRTGLKLLALGLACFGLYTCLGYAGRESDFVTCGFYPAFAMNLFWTVAAAGSLWYGGIWPAGDAKFFIVLSAALPLADPHLRWFPHQLFLVVLINTFVAGALWAVGSFVASGFVSSTAWRFIRETKEYMVRRLSELVAAKNRFAAAGYLLNLTFLFLLQQVFAMEMYGILGRFFSRLDIFFFFMFILWEKIRGLFRSRRWTYVTAACYLIYFFAGFFYFRDHLWLLLINSFKNVLRFSVVLFLGRFLLVHLLEKKDLEYLTAAELEPGVVLSENSAHVFKENAVFDGAFDEYFKDGLTQEQVGLLKDWLGNLKTPDSKVEVVRGRPFALWIFAGAVITLIFNRNLGSLLR